MIFLYFILLFQLSAHAQVREDIANYILSNSSDTKNYAIFFKGYDDKLRFIWSEYLLEYFDASIDDNGKSFQIVKQKLVNGNRINIETDRSVPVLMLDNGKLNMIAKDAAIGLDFFIAKYFNNGQLKAENVDLLKEICYVLWKQRTYVFIGLQNGNLPTIEIKNNRIINATVKINAGYAAADTGVYFYFSKYDCYLDSKTKDTTKVYLKVRSTDVTRLSPEIYHGEYEYAKFIVNWWKKRIIAYLFGKKDQLKLEEVYLFNEAITTREETYFYNMSASTKTVKRRVIVPEFAE